MPINCGFKVSFLHASYYTCYKLCIFTTKEVGYKALYGVVRARKIY